MRRIRIDKKLEAKVNSFCDNLFLERRFELPLVTLKNLVDTLTNGLTELERAYVKKITDNYNQILKATPSEIEVLIKEFDLIINHNFIRRPFRDLITKALRYEDYREREYLDFIKDLGINTCVYCNAQLTIVINLRKIQQGARKGQFEREGKFEVDHFHSQSKYPFLCTSFYNLIPCCSNCNKSKSDDNSLFYLYTGTDNLESFVFKIDNDSLDKYFTTRKRSDLEIRFESTENDLLTNHKELFRIEEIYATQKDVAEEIINKAEAYTLAYKQGLVDTFKDLFPDKALINKLLIGNYDKPDEIHKRPLAKFMQDIARQVGLIR